MENDEILKNKNGTNLAIQVSVSELKNPVMLLEDLITLVAYYSNDQEVNECLSMMLACTKAIKEIADKLKANLD
jgi:hypothetical protein